MPESGLTLSRQAAAGDVRVELDGRPPAAVWATIAERDGFVDAVRGAVRDLLAGTHHADRWRRLEDAGVTAADGAVAAALTAFDRPREHSRHRQAKRLLAEFGQGEPSVLGWPLPLDAVGDGPLAVIGTTDVPTPVVTVRIRQGFEDQRADQRRDIARLLAALADVCDVRVVGTGRQLRWLARAHHAELPGSVRDQCNAGPTDGPVEEAVQAARDALDADGTAVALLRALADTATETRSYDALASALPVSRSTVKRQANDLRDRSLVDVFGPRTARKVELTRAGRAFLERLDEALGRQTTLPDSVQDPGNPHNTARVTPPTHEATADPTAETATPDRPRDRLADLHGVEYLSRREAVPAGSTPPDGGVSVTNYPVQPRRDRASDGWSYDADRDRLTVSVEYDNPMAWTIGLAVAFTDSRTFTQVLDADRLEESDLADLVDDAADYLRRTRCLGYLPEDVDGVADYVDRLQDARDDLRELTGRLRRGDYPDETSEAEFRGLILREARGLAGTVAHLLDLAGVEIAVETRFVEFTRRFDDDRVGTFLDYFRPTAAVLARYGNHVAYRHLLETRAGKREQTLDPTIDAADPYGESIVSWSFVGEFGSDDRLDAFVDRLRRRLARTDDVHEDAPEFAVRLPVTKQPHGRSAYAAVAQELLAAKGLEATREAVSLLEAFCATPYDAADALAALGREEKAPGRAVRPAEIRYALAHLEASRLTPGVSRTPKRVLSALLAADRPLDRTRLANAADVSTRSLREHLPDLLATGLVVETPEGYRLDLALDTDEERLDYAHVPVYTAVGHDEDPSPDHLPARRALQQAAHETGIASGGGAGVDPPGWGLVYGPLEALGELREPEPWLTDVLPSLWAVSAPESRGSTAETTAPEAVTVGPRLEQAPIGADGTAEVAT